MKCGLINLGTLVAEAKYQGMLSKHEKHTSLSDQKCVDEAWEQGQRDLAAKAAKRQGVTLKVVNRARLINSSKRVTEADSFATLQRVISHLPPLSDF